jgi:hypothetical protein
MMRTCTALLMTSTLLVGLVPLATADTSGRPPVSRGVVATITRIDDHKGMATLTTEEGNVFELPKDSLWKVGSKVECNLIEAAPHPRLQDCQPWK